MMYEELVKKLRSHNGWALNETLDEAANVIEATSKAYQMMAEAYEAEVTKSRWIPVTERLPEEDEAVLTWGKQAVVLIDWHRNGEWFVADGVTHWMPLPKPPKKE